MLTIVAVLVSTMAVTAIGAFTERTVKIRAVAQTLAPITGLAVTPSGQGCLVLFNKRDVYIVKDGPTGSGDTSWSEQGSCSGSWTLNGQDTVGSASASVSDFQYQETWGNGTPTRVEISAGLSTQASTSGERVEGVAEVRYALKFTTMQRMTVRIQADLNGGAGGVICLRDGSAEPLGHCGGGFTGDLDQSKTVHCPEAACVLEVFTSMKSTEDGTTAASRMGAAAASDGTVSVTTTLEPAGECDITGTGGPDVLDGTNKSEKICGRGGADIIRGRGGNDVIRGGGGDDEIYGGDGADEIHGEGGDDEIHGQRGADGACGGAGDDEIHGGPGAFDHLEGGAGADTIHGEAGADAVIGGDGGLFCSGTGADGKNSLTGGGGGDVITGGPLRDTIRGGGGADTIVGNEGPDRIFGGAKGDTLDGGDGNDRIRGEAGSDTIKGGEGNDRICGDQGADTLQGEAGDDTIGGGGSGDTIRGGAGSDELGGNRNGTGCSSSGTDGIDDIEGGDGLDYLYGDRAGDSLSGGAGPDLVAGGPGADDIDGGPGEDGLLGGGGNDSILADDGELDQVAGGAGSGDRCDWDDGLDVVSGCEQPL